MAKSVDLTTLPGWASLSTGSHNITIVAKADGYKDSEPSVGVTVTKEAEADALAGTWVFNDNAYDVYTNKTFNVTFVSNGQTFNSIINNTNPKTGGLFYDTLQVVHPDNAGTFIDQNYQTITITSKLSEVTDGDTLLAWLQSNATKQ